MMRLLLRVCVACVIGFCCCRVCFASPDTNKIRDALQSALGEKLSNQRLESLSAFATGLTLREIPEALKIVEEIKSIRDRFAFKFFVLKRWGELEPSQAFAYVAGEPESLTKVEAIRTIAVSFARSNPPAAAAAALKMPPGRARVEAVSLIAEEWARHSTKDALAWAYSFTNEVLRRTALKSIYFVLVRSDPVQVSRVVTALPHGPIRTALIVNVAENLVALDPDGAIKWAQSLPETEERRLALSIAVESWADFNPTAAFIFATNFQDEDLSRQLTSIVLERWALQDPLSAFEEARKLKDPELRRGSIVRIITVSSPMDPRTIAKLILHLDPSDPVWDDAIEAYVDEIHVWNPEAAMSLALKASDLTRRNQLVEKVFKVWLKFDIETARKWIGTAPLAEDSKRRLSSLTPELEF